MKREALKKRLVFADILVKLHKHTKKAGAFWDFGGRISEIVAENVKKGEENVTRVGRLWQICRKRGEMSRGRRRYGGRERRRGKRRAVQGKRGAAWGVRGGVGGAGRCRGSAGRCRGSAGRCREGAEGVGGVWVREGAGRCRGVRGKVQGKRPSPRRTGSRGRGQPHRPGETGKRGGRGHLSTLAGGTMTSADTGNVGGWEGGSFAAGAPAKCLPVGALWQGAF